MDRRGGISDFFLGLIGVAVIGLLVAVMLFSLLPMSGQNELAEIEPNRSMDQSQNPAAPPTRTN
jgi:hypothetical protein